MNNIGTWVAHFVRPCKQKKSYMRVWLPCVQAYEIRLRIYHIRERYGKDIFLWLAYLTVDGKNIAISLRDLNAPTKKLILKNIFPWELIGHGATPAVKFLIKKNRDFFMENARVRFLFTSCVASTSEWKSYKAFSML